MHLFNIQCEFGQQVYKFCESEGLQKLGVHSDTGKRKGCGMYCYKNEKHITCPSCKVFVWHKTCLIPFYGQFGLKTPNIQSDDRSCPNCMK